MIDDQQSDTAPSMGDEQAADLRRLQLAAAEPDADQASQEAAAADQAAAEQDSHAQGNSQQVAFILALAVPILGQIFPSILEIYTDQAQAAVSGTVGPVLTKYGVDLSNMATDYGAEIACVMVCGPIALATYKGVSSDLAAKKEQAPKAIASNSQEQPKAAPEVERLG